MGESFVVDTNVLITANGRPEDGCEAVPECVEIAASFLLRVENTDDSVVVLDTLYEILDEYQSYCEFGGKQLGPGDQFFIWLHRNQANTVRVHQAVLTRISSRGFDEFPDDPDLSSFDKSDRKFVAAALSSGRDPEIANSGDRGWWNFQDELERNGCRLRFLCPERAPA